MTNEFGGQGAMHGGTAVIGGVECAVEVREGGEHVGLQLVKDGAPEAEHGKDTFESEVEEGDQEDVEEGINE